MKGKGQVFFEKHILVLNSNSEECAFLERLCARVARVESVTSLEEAIARLARTEFDTAIVDASFAEYSRLKGLFRKKTSLLLTGFSETQLRRIAQGWPKGRHIDVIPISVLRENESELDAALEQALMHTHLLEEVENLRANREKNRIELGEAFHQIHRIKKTVESSVVKEIEKRLAAENRLNWFRKEKQRIEALLKKIYLSNDVTSLMDVFTDIQELVGAEGISFYLLEESDNLGKYLKPLVWDGGVPRHVDISRLTVKLNAHDFAAAAIRDGQEIILSELSANGRFSDRYQSLRYPLRSLLTMPLRHDKEVIGVIEVYNKNGRHAKTGFTNGDQRVLRQLSEHISIAIAKLNLIQYDALTGLLRPDAFFEKIIHKLHAENKRRREALGYALVMGDVDWFKNYNDRNGHQAGNLLLRELALILKSSIREEDLLCRYGGEEFLFFLTGIRDQEQALLLTDRIRKNVEDHYFKHQEFQPRGNLTMSFGVTCFDRTHINHPPSLTPQDLKRLISEADLAMAEAKGKMNSALENGEESEPPPDKNRISLFQSDERGLTDTGGLPVPRKFPLTEEKRRFPRYLTSLSLIYKNGDGHRVTKTLNLSLGGTKISTDDLLDSSSTLDLTIVLGKRAFQCKGVIVYSQEGLEGIPAYYTGLKFWNLSLNDRQLLEKFIASLTARSPRLE